MRRDSDPAVKIKQYQIQNLHANSGSKNRREMNKLQQKSVREIDAGRETKARDRRSGLAPDGTWKSHRVKTKLSNEKSLGRGPRFRRW
jgi:hypothetical protein